MELIDLERMTDEFGEGWAGSHVRRLFQLIGRIDAGLDYDREALAYAVWLHDWGAFSRYYRAGIDHGLRSRQVAEADILPQTGLTEAQKKIILDAIEYHDYRCVLPAWSQEAVLLREADFLDFLGAIGVVREFAWGPNQLRKLSSVSIRAGREFAGSSAFLPHRLWRKNAWRVWEIFWNGSTKKVLGNSRGMGWHDVCEPCVSLFLDQDGGIPCQRYILREGNTMIRSK